MSESYLVAVKMRAAEAASLTRPEDATSGAMRAAEAASTLTRPGDATSGALSWARECRMSNGRMRSWIDLTAAGCDGMLWTACLILLRHLETEKPAGWWRGRRVLELGSGTGHLAVGLARLGASVVATESAEFDIDGGQAGFDSMVKWTTHLLASSTGLDGASVGGGSVAFRKLHWGLDDLPPNRWDGFDVVLLSELYFDPDLHEALLQTLVHVLAPGMVAYSIFCDRPFSLGFLAMLDDEGSFETEVIDLKETLDLDDDEILYAHVITRRLRADVPAEGQGAPQGAVPGGSGASDVLH